MVGQDEVVVADVLPRLLRQVVLALRNFFCGLLNNLSELLAQLLSLLVEHAESIMLGGTRGSWRHGRPSSDRVG